MKADDFRSAAHAIIEQVITCQEDRNGQDYLIKLHEPQRTADETSSPVDRLFASLPVENFEAHAGAPRGESLHLLSGADDKFTYPTLLSEIYSAAFTAPGFVWDIDAPGIEIETQVGQWLARALRLPENFMMSPHSNGGGFLFESNSAAFQRCIAAARERYITARCAQERLLAHSRGYEDRSAYIKSRLVVVSSDQASGLTNQATQLCGVQSLSVSTSVDDGFSLNMYDLPQTLNSCVRDGLEPFMIVLSLGGGQSCINDDVRALQNIQTSFPNTWIHVDASDGGLFMFHQVYSDRFRHSLNFCDSVNFDFRRLMLPNVATTCLFAQDISCLFSTLQTSKATFPSSMLRFENRAQIFARRRLALKLWTFLDGYGLGTIQSDIESASRMTWLFKKCISKRPDLFTVLARPHLGQVCFRVRNEAVQQHLGYEATQVYKDTHLLEMIDHITNKICQDLAAAIEQKGEYPVVKGQHRGTHYLKFIGPFTTYDKNLVFHTFQGILRTTVETIGRWKIVETSSAPTEDPKPRKPLVVIAKPVTEEEEESEYASLPDDDKAVDESNDEQS